MNLKQIYLKIDKFFTPKRMRDNVDNTISFNCRNNGWDRERFTGMTYGEKQDFIDEKEVEGELFGK